MGSSGDQQDESLSTGERPVSPENNVDQSHCPRDERTVSADPSRDAIVVEWLRQAQEQTGFADPGRHFSITHPPNNHSPFVWDATHGGYIQNVGGWDGYPQYTGLAALHAPPVVYYQNPSLLFRPGYGYNSMPPYMLEGQIYSPQWIPTYHPQPACFVMSPAMYISPTEPVKSNSNGDNLLSDTINEYISHGGVNFSGSQGTSPSASPASYSQSTSTLGPYKKNTGQLPLHGYPASSSSGGYTQGEPCPSTFTGNEQNASAASAPSASLYNRPDFETDYTNAKFFIIKPLFVDNVCKSIKYNVWTSSRDGNNKLDAAYHVTKEIDADSPVFLFFSVVASGHFCGVAEMVGPVNFEKDAECWQQGKWSGQFPVKWHIIKDVPNDQFRLIPLQDNNNRPVSPSQNCEEVKLEQGIEMLKIFKDYHSLTSLLDENIQEQEMVEKQQNERVSSPMEHASDDSVNQICDRLLHILENENSSGLISRISW